MQGTIWCTKIPPDAWEIKYATDLPGKIITFLICTQKKKKSNEQLET